MNFLYDVCHAAYKNNDVIRPRTNSTNFPNSRKFAEFTEQVRVISV